MKRAARLKRRQDNVFRVAVAGNLSAGVNKTGDIQTIHALMTRDWHVDI